MSSIHRLAGMDLQDLDLPLEEQLSQLQDWLEAEKDKFDCFDKVSTSNSSHHSRDYQQGICSWRNVAHRDGNRLPHVIHRAVCLCEDCSRSGSSGIQWGCQEVLRPMRVARRTSEDGPFFIDVELVPTACVCRGTEE